MQNARLPRTPIFIIPFLVLSFLIMNTLSPNFDLAAIAALAREAGKMALDYFRNTTVTMKADDTPVTAADKAIERFLTAELRERYPEFGILGEEGADFDENATYRWVLDPIDGTNAFAAGLPVWGVSIGLLRGSQPLAGVFYLPAVNDCFAVDLEGPATLNGRPIHVAPAEQPITAEDIILGSADAHLRWDIRFPGKVRAFGSCAAHFCYVAAGSALAGLNTYTAIWDIAAALPILTRAGGSAELLSGKPLPLDAAARGVKIPEPVFFGSPHYLDAIRAQLHPKTYAKK
jgi:myo-inositol-1(or 4)-monophosphatase